MFKYRWLSWYQIPQLGAFTLYFPWWVSGECIMSDRRVMCAAIPFECKKLSKQIIETSFDEKKVIENIEWRFNILKYGSPFSERFPSADWMWWPE